jgi:hypothetical protein
MSKRTDIHRPSAINPGDYAPTGRIYDLKYDDLETMEVGTKPYGHCNHCGKAIRWAVEQEHKSGNIVVFGEICADILGLSDSRIKHEMVLLKRRVKNLEKKMKYEREAAENAEYFKARFPELHSFLTALDTQSEKSGFVTSLHWSWKKFGMLTQAQSDALKKVIKDREERAAAKLLEPIPTVPLAEGQRLQLEGEIVSTKYDYNGAFPGPRMLVRLSDANKVYGTVPANISDSAQRGAKIKFVATVKRSNNDEHFGYFSRPSNAQIS